MRFFRPFLSILVPGAVALTAAPLWAEDVHEAAAKAGMPQLDMTFFPSQIFWLIITFAVLYFLMKRFALPGIERTQQKRHEAIAADLAAANAANEAAKKIIADYEKTLAGARAQAQASIAEITTEAAKQSMEQQAQQQQALSKKLQEAEARIAEVRDAALRDAQSVVSEIANAAIEKVTGLKVQVK